ncbi:MAG: alpha/beta hydrolase [Phreatobacter sp.]|uniref:alpha/beta fold hydrolase n=1 Tax=Phreatobacter sp. TaxID=1966341 RepID=UPI00273375BE|nr:alpha/beta hydrolase [Phreatobacter sp.]MDP2802243.1 alpha/beta hydrolase [Phreatobacter sp.]
MTTTPADPGDRLSIALPDGAMSGLRWGAGETPPDLVFLHANGFNAATYGPLLAPLGAGNSIVALDLRGHGLSSLPAEPVRMTNWNAYADDLVEVLDRIVPAGARPPILAGHSMGSVAALLAAARRPARVRGLVLLDPVMMHPWLWLYARTPWGAARMRNIDLAVGAAKRRAVFPSRDEAVATYRTRKTFASWQPGFLEGYVAGGFVDDPEGVRLACAPAWEAANFASQTQNPWGALKRVEVPVRILAGGVRSTVYGGEARLARVAPHVPVETLPDTSHFFPMERPDRVRDVLREALAQS